MGRMWFMYWLILYAAVVAMPVFARPGEHLGDIPPCYAGVWSGSAYQGGGPPWPVMVLLSSDGDGSADYPSLGCAGRLELKDRLDKGYRFREKLYKGHGRCVDGGQVTLHLVGRGLLHYLWEDLRSGESAAGLLRKSPTFEARKTIDGRTALAATELKGNESAP